MKKWFITLFLISCTVTLPACNLWVSEDEPIPLAAAKKAENVLYLHEQITRYSSTQEAFRSITRQGNVVVDYYADWCPPCKRLGNSINQIAGNFPNVTFLKVNIDQFKDIASGIRSIPVLVFYKNGSEVKRSSGFKSSKELQNLINKVF